MKKKVALFVCTFKRPKLLDECLQSLVKLKIDDRFDLSVTVIDNEPSDQAHKITENFISQAPFRAMYVREPQRGLCYARNHGIELALSQGAEYIGFFDDDETIEPNWLFDMFKSFKDTEADALAGPIIINRAPEISAALNDAYRFKIPKTYAQSATLPMGNVIFHKKLVESGLRFDLKFNRTGGEDVDFFRRAAQNGAKLYRTPYGTVYETLTAEKKSFRAYFNRQVRVARLHYMQKYPKFSAGLMKEFFLAVPETVGALAFGVASPFSDKAKIKALKWFAKSCGRILSRFSATTNAYGN